jgi:hypothetical protein
MVGMEGPMAQLIAITHEPKVLELEEFSEGQVRLVLTLSKLNQVTKLDFILTADEASGLAQALQK